MGGVLHKVFSFKSRLVVIAIGLVIGVSSLLFTNNMTAQLREKEKNEVDVWVAAFRELGADPGNPLLLSIITTRNNIPFILIDRDQRVIASHLIPEHILNHPDLLNKKLVELAEINPRIKVETLYNETFYIFFDESGLLKSLTYFPYIQLLVIIVFVLFGYIALRSTKQDEQNRVWIGLAKETAHQLGTPTSSLLGWLEYLRTQNIDPTAIAEMNKDIIRLTKVVDRFSKIGAATSLSEGVVNEIVGNSVIYFRTRVPKNVTISYNGLAMAQQKAMLNEALFEWVIENLLKNAMDALSGKGTIDVKLSNDDNWIYIDVKDTGKGIAKGNFKRIFDPGFTTKTRGWGLGLSLSKRIIEEAHNGKIFVLDSEINKGTTIRIALKKIYS